MSFLDTCPFRPDDPDSRELVNVLSLAIHRSAQVEQVVRAIPLPVAALVWERPAIELWPDVCTLAAEQRKLRRLVEVLLPDVNMAAHKGYLEGLLSAPIVVQPDPFDAHLLGPGARRAFINRRALREHLRDLADPLGERVLIITGPASSGKSYTRHLIHHLAEHSGFTPHYLDCRTWVGAPAGPRELMGMIAMSLGWSPPEVDTTAQDDTVARMLLAWFNGRMRDDGRAHWLVIDSLDAGTLTEPALRLVQEIAEAAHQQMAGDLRVVLTAFHGALHHEVDPFVRRDELAGFDLQELHTFFVDLSQLTGTSPPSQEEIDQIIVEGVGELEAGKTPPPDRLSRLIAAVGEIGSEMVHSRG